MKVIGYEEVFARMDARACIGVMREAFVSLRRDIGKQYLRTVQPLPGGSILGLMPAYFSEQYFGVKVISVFHKNTGTGYPSHQGLVLLFDSVHGEPLCAVDANAVTQIRTGAVSALATDLLANPGVTTAAFLGAGAQARSHLAAIREVRPIDAVFVYDRNEAFARAFSEHAAERYGVRAHAVQTPAEAVKEAGIVCTLTPSHAPLLFAADIAPGTHINAVGACTPNARELGTDLVAKARFFGDQKEAVFKEAGDFLIPRSEGAVGDAHFLGELGQLVEGEIAGRASAQDITVFEALGLAIEDVAAAKFIYEHALQNP